jgi:hypothetical protein
MTYERNVDLATNPEDKICQREPPLPTRTLSARRVLMESRISSNSRAGTATSDWTAHLFFRYDLSPIGESDSHHTFIGAGPIFLTPCLSPSNDKQNSFHQRTHHHPRDVFFSRDANAALSKIQLTNQQQQNTKIRIPLSYPSIHWPPDPWPPNPTAHGRSGAAAPTNE